MTKGKVKVNKTTLALPDPFTVGLFYFMRGTWRESAKPIIAKVIKDNQGKTEKEIRKALRDAYPWGERRYHPYKIWCDEVKVQTGRKKRKQFIHPENQPGLF